MGGNLTLSYAEKYVASGLAALIVAVTPLWFLVLDTLLLGDHMFRCAAKSGSAWALPGWSSCCGPTDRDDFIRTSAAVGIDQPAGRVV